MSDRHMLLRSAFRFPVQPRPTVDGWRYRRDLAAWVDEADPEVLMVTPPLGKPGEPPPPQPPKPVPMSKKADQETGEDMKGA